MTQPDEELAAMGEYWKEYLDNFELQIYPIFHERGYSKNTALMAYALDQLDTAVMMTLARRGEVRNV